MKNNNRLKKVKMKTIWAKCSIIDIFKGMLSASGVRRRVITDRCALNNTAVCFVYPLIITLIGVLRKMYAIGVMDLDT